MYFVCTRICIVPLLRFCIIFFFIADSESGKIVAAKVHLSDYMHRHQVWDKWIIEANKRRKMTHTSESKKKKKKSHTVTMAKNAEIEKVSPLDNGASEDQSQAADEKEQPRKKKKRKTVEGSEVQQPRKVKKAAVTDDTQKKRKKSKRSS